MTEQEMFNELDFIRIKLWEIAGNIKENNTNSAMFMIGQLYAEIRIKCLSLKPNGDKSD